MDNSIVWDDMQALLQMALSVIFLCECLLYRKLEDKNHFDAKEWMYTLQRTVFFAPDAFVESKTGTSGSETTCESFFFDSGFVAC